MGLTRPGARAAPGTTASAIEAAEVVGCPDAATAQSARPPPAGAEVVWAGAGRERGRGRGANSGLEEGGAQAETAGGEGPKLGAERERGRSSSGWGVGTRGGVSGGEAGPRQYRDKSGRGVFKGA